MAEQRRGAPRSEAARQAILDATAHQFQTRGYDQLTIEGVAAAAGVGKQTIYRWWPTKSALVAECLVEDRLLPGKFSVPDSGDFRADLIAWLGHIFAVVHEPTGRSLLTSLVAAATANRQIGERLRVSLGDDRSLAQRFETAIKAGRLAPDTPASELSEALVGAVFIRALGSTPSGPADAERLIDALFGPWAIAA